MINEDILNSWNEISTYLGVSDRTAQRYAKERGLPVVKDYAGHPIIKKESIDEWKLKPLNL